MASNSVAMLVFNQIWHIIEIVLGDGWVDSDNYFIVSSALVETALM